MPMYIFYNPDEEECFEEYLSYEQFDKLPRDAEGMKYITKSCACGHDNVDCYLDLGEQLAKTKIEDSEIWNGMESRALAVHPDQIPEVKADAKRHGVEVDFNPKNGNVIFSSRKNRREYCKLRGVVDYEGGYGDNV
jgi:hypothetical protein